MRVLIIGGTKFAGPFLVRRLVAAGHDVTIFHRGQHEADLPPEVQHVHSKSSSFLALHFPEDLRRMQPEVVVHMIPMGEEDALAAVRFFRGHAGRIIGISSGDVYRAYGILAGMEDGPVITGLLTEDSPLREKLYIARTMAKDQSDWMYHYEKILAERAVLSDAELPATILRLPAVYGPGDEQHRFFPWLKRMQDRRPVILLGKAQANWRWTNEYVDNVAAAIVATVTTSTLPGRIYNVGEVVTPTVAERIASMAKLMNWHGNIKRIPDENLPAHLRQPFNFQQHLAYDTTRIRRELAYQEPVGAEEATRTTVEWELANPPAQVDAKQFDYAAEDAAIQSPLM